MENKLLIIKGILAGIGAFIGDKLGILCPAMLLFILLMLLDYVSGMLAAKKEAIDVAPLSA